MQRRQYRGNLLFEANGGPADLSQADVFYHLGDVTFPDAKLQPLIVDGLLGARSLVGLTCDKLIHQHGKSKLSLQMSSCFFAHCLSRTCSYGYRWGSTKYRIWRNAMLFFLE